MQDLAGGGQFWTLDNPGSSVRGRLAAAGGKKVEVTLDAGVVDDPRVRQVPNGLAFTGSAPEVVEAFQPITLQGCVPLVCWADQDLNLRPLRHQGMGRCAVPCRGVFSGQVKAFRLLACVVFSAPTSSCLGTRGDTGRVSPGRSVTYSDRQRFAHPGYRETSRCTAGPDQRQPHIGATGVQIPAKYLDTATVPSK